MMRSVLLSLVCLGVVALALATQDEGRVLVSPQNVKAEVGELDVGSLMPSARGGHSMLEHERKLFLWGGCDLASHCDQTLFSFDIEQERWQVEPTSGNTPLASMGHAAWIGGDNPFMWVFGGYTMDSNRKGDFTGELRALHIATKRWVTPTVTGTPPSPRYEASAVKTNNTHAVIFGGSKEKQFFSDVHIFDAGSFQWVSVTTSGDQPLSRESHSAVVLGSDANQKMVIYGGYHDDQCLDDVYSLHIGTMTWKKIGNGGVARGGHQAFLISSRVFVIGGCNEPQQTCHQGLTMLDTETEQWAVAATGRSVSAREWTGVSVYQQRVYVFGGCLPNDRCFNDTWLIEFDDVLDPLVFVSPAEQAEEARKQQQQQQQLREQQQQQQQLREQQQQQQERSQQSNVQTGTQVLQSGGATTTTSTEVGETPLSTDVPIIYRDSCNRTTNNNNVTTPTGPVDRLPPSRPGREMMEKLKAIRRELKLAEDVCSNMGKGNTTEPDETLLPCDEGFEGCGYRGVQQTTRGGHTCQAWDCWKNPDDDEGACVNFPDKLKALSDDWESVSTIFGLGSHNYCRNPDGEDGIYCFTTNETVPFDLCDPKPEKVTVSSSGVLSANQTASLTSCPEGTVTVKLTDLNLEMFNMLMAANQTAASKAEGEEGEEGEAATAEGDAATAPEGEEPPADAEEPPAEAEPPSPDPALHTSRLIQHHVVTFLEVEEDEGEAPGDGGEAGGDGDAAEGDADAAEGGGANKTSSTLGYDEAVVCFGKTGPVAIIGANLTLHDLFEAMEYNRTLQPSRLGGFMPSPSPAPKLYNDTAWTENGRMMGRRVDQGKRRPLSEVAGRVDARLRGLNCTDADAINRPECTQPFGNLTGHLNATANWTKGDGKGDGEADGGEGGDGGAAGDAAGDAAGGEDGGQGGDGVGVENCAPEDAECLARQNAQGGDGVEACAPDDAECLAKQGAGEETACDPEKEDCEAGQTGGAGQNSTTGVLGGGAGGAGRGNSTSDQIMDLIEENGPVVALGALALFALFLSLGAVLTSMMKEKRKIAKLEESLKDAQLKAQDEVWAKQA